MDPRRDLVKFSQKTENGNAVKKDTLSAKGQTTDQAAAKKRFEEACARLKANVNKHVAALEITETDSSDEEPLVSSDIVSQVFKQYGHDLSESGKIQDLLTDALKGVSSVCLICIESVKKTDAIWSCGKCYCPLHLTCIQRWAKDSIFHQSEAATDRLAPGTQVDIKKFNWCCPKCREEYNQQVIPTKYLCYCKKVADPKFDAWLLPHSCGQTCGKQLEPKCSHSCLLLCHPGPCPPCPKTVTVTCYCGKQPPQPRRCSFQTWGCGSPCGKLLSCKQHKCPHPCHGGECLPCTKRSVQKCLCGKHSEERPCESATWQCQKGNSLKKEERGLKREIEGKPEISKAVKGKGNRKIKKGKKGKSSCTRRRKKRENRAPSKGKPKSQSGSTGSRYLLVCGRSLACGHHTCNVVCHSGSCPPCPLSLKRTCPCGKKEVLMPCTVETTTCGDTCGKPLECGAHFCAERCHKGNCGTCLQMRTQRCRCGAKEKELPCYKNFTCEIKCKQVKDCRRHPCNRKCCPGNCPPCDQPCNRTLGCKNHKCASRCHPGACYPCPLMVDVKCACGSTVLTVPCGSERITKPPKCSQRCMKPPDCHHPVRTKHACHFGDCPPCRQLCGKIHAACGHVCPASCHSAVLVQVNNISAAQRSGPWEPKLAPKMEVRNLACPPCEVPVSVTCLGGHETTDWPCYRSTPSSCQRPCGRTLQCTNHFCQSPCHRLNDVSKNEPWNCETCEAACSKPRPLGCSHPCPRGKCHPSPCPPCTKLCKHSCHCVINPQYVRCVDWTDADDAAKKLLLSCKDQCPKLMACGHRCSLTCHSGACSSVDQCSVMVQVTCDCRRIKKNVACNFAKSQAKIECDGSCRRKKDQGLKAQAEKERQRVEEEERRNREELEMFERKFGQQRRKKSDRKRHSTDEVESLLTTRTKILAVVVLLAGSLAAFFFKDTL